MLSELDSLQSSDESVRNIDLTFDVETKSRDDSELVMKKYTFSYAEQFDTWHFHRYKEKRTPNTSRMTNRNWRTVEEIIWNDVHETQKIDVPPEVTQKLSQATGSESITIQPP